MDTVVNPTSTSQPKIEHKYIQNFQCGCSLYQHVESGDFFYTRCLPHAYTEFKQNEEMKSRLRNKYAELNTKDGKISELQTALARANQS